MCILISTRSYSSTHSEGNVLKKISCYWPFSQIIGVDIFGQDYFFRKSCFKSLFPLRLYYRIALDPVWPELTPSPNKLIGSKRRTSPNKALRGVSRNYDRRKTCAPAFLKEMHNNHCKQDPRKRVFCGVGNYCPKTRTEARLMGRGFYHKHPPTKLASQNCTRYKPPPPDPQPAGSQLSEYNLGCHFSRKLGKNRGGGQLSGQANKN